MPTLTIAGKKPGPPPKDPLTEIGAAIIRVIEASREVGRLQQRLDDQSRWLDANPTHPRHGERENTRWHGVMETNRLKQETRDRIGELSRAISAAGQGARDECSETLGATVGPGMGVRLARLAEAHREVGFFGVIDAWSMGDTT